MKIKYFISATAGALLYAIGSQVVLPAVKAKRAQMEERKIWEALEAETERANQQLFRGTVFAIHSELKDLRREFSGFLNRNTAVTNYESDFKLIGRPSFTLTNSSISISNFSPFIPISQ